MAQIGLIKEYDNSTKLSAWYPMVKENFQKVEDKINGNIQTDNLENGAVTAAKIAASAVATAHIADGNVTTGKLADKAVSTNKIATAAVTTEKLADNAVTNDKLYPGAVTSDKIGIAQVTGDRIKAGVITSEKLTDGAVTSAKLTDGAVTATKIADGAVTLAKLAPEVMEDINDTYMRRVTVSKLPSSSVLYNFEDGAARFSVPKIGTAAKGVSEVITDGNNNYQSVCSTGAPGASTTIGSSSVVYSELDLSAVTSGASDITFEFDFQMRQNGRMRVSIGDLDILRTLDGSTKYDTAGIAADMFSNSGNRFEICGAGGVRQSFFGTWLHCRFELDTVNKTVNYTVVNSLNSADRMVGTVAFKGECDKVTGIALYTWLADDTVYFDNISIMARFNAEENVIYSVNDGDVYKHYVYIDGAPVMIGRSDTDEIATEVAELGAAMPSTETDVVQLLSNIRTVDPVDTSADPNSLTITLNLAADKTIDAVYLFKHTDNENAYDGIAWEPGTNGVATTDASGKPSTISQDGYYAVQFTGFTTNDTVKVLKRWDLSTDSIVRKLVD